MLNQYSIIKLSSVSRKLNLHTIHHACSLVVGTFTSKVMLWKFLMFSFCSKTFVLEMKIISRNSQATERNGLVFPHLNEGDKKTNLTVSFL